MIFIISKQTNGLYPVYLWMYLYSNLLWAEFRNFYSNLLPTSEVIYSTKLGIFIERHDVLSLSDQVRTSIPI